MNRSLPSALLLELKESGSKIGQFEDNALLYDLSSYLEWNGFSDTLSKVGALLWWKAQILLIRSLSLTRTIQLIRSFFSLDLR